MRVEKESMNRVSRHSTNCRYRNRTLPRPSPALNGQYPAYACEGRISTNFVARSRSISVFIRVRVEGECNSGKNPESSLWWNTLPWILDRRILGLTETGIFPMVKGRVLTCKGVTGAKRSNFTSKRALFYGVRRTRHRTH